VKKTEAQRSYMICPITHLKTYKAGIGTWEGRLDNFLSTLGCSQLAQIGIKIDDGYLCSFDLQ
jgi:hypothetical protein